VGSKIFAQITHNMKLEIPEGTYTVTVANEGYGIATAVVGLILTATRILDGVTDPIIAIIIDKMNFTIFIDVGGAF
jgi:hypothetical protein